MKPIEIRLIAEKATLNTQRYEADDPDAPVRFIYLQNSVFARGDPPGAIIVTIVEDAG